MPAGVLYAINDIEVTTPDEEVWTPIVTGLDLNSLQKRSPYQRLEWRKTVANECYLDWWQFANTVLSSLTCRPPGLLDEFTTYTDVRCQSVTLRQRLSVATEVVATFVVYIG